VIFTNPKKDEALQNLSAAIHDRAKSGFVPAQPEARLAHAESLINAGTTAAGRAQDAAAKGFNSIAKVEAILSTRPPRLLPDAKSGNLCNAQGEWKPLNPSYCSVKV
jgi:hypothetical protein